MNSNSYTFESRVQKCKTSFMWILKILPVNEGNMGLSPCRKKKTYMMDEGIFYKYSNMSLLSSYSLYL